MAGRLAATRVPRREAAKAARPETRQGVLGSRILAYIIDSLVLGIFAMAFAGAGAAYMGFDSDWGKVDVREQAQWVFVYASLAAIPFWLVFNLILLTRQGQSMGQFIMGLRVAREDGRDIGPVRALAYLLALHPLMFHPIVAGFWAVLALVALSLTSSDVLALGSLAVAALCLVAPLVALAAVVSEGGRRALHDRIAATQVVRLE